MLKKATATSCHIKLYHSMMPTPFSWAWKHSSADNAWSAGKVDRNPATWGYTSTAGRSFSSPPVPSTTTMDLPLLARRYTLSLSFPLPPPPMHTHTHRYTRTLTSLQHLARGRCMVCHCAYDPYSSCRLKIVLILSLPLLTSHQHLMCP